MVVAIVSECNAMPSVMMMMMMIMMTPSSILVLQQETKWMQDTSHITRHTYRC